MTQLKAGDRVWLTDEVESQKPLNERLTGTVTDSKIGYWHNGYEKTRVSIDSDQVSVNWDGMLQKSVEYIEDLTKIT